MRASATTCRVVGRLVMPLVVASCAAHSPGAKRTPDEGPLLDSVRSFLIDVSDSLEREWRKGVKQLVQESPAYEEGRQDPRSAEIILAIDEKGQLVRSANGASSAWPAYDAAALQAV